METKGNVKVTQSTELAAYLADTGSANAYAVALRPAITAYTTGLKITFQVANTNTGASTLAVNGLATVPIKKNVSVALFANDLVANEIVTVIYDGTNFQLQNLLQPIPVVSIASNYNPQEVGIVLTKAGTVTGAIGVGSSLFLQRLLLPAAMALSEIDAALRIDFPATNQGAGTISRSMALYSFGNSTSLASVVSASGTSAWSTGTSTTAGAVSLTQFQGGWSSALIQPMTFASSALKPGEYVVGQLFNFAQGSSTWTLNFYGINALQTALVAAATGITSATLSAASTFTTGSSALTAWTATPATASVMLSNALGAASGVTGVSSYASSIIPLAWGSDGAASGLTGFTLSVGSSSGTIASGVTALAMGLSGSGTIKSSASQFQLVGASSNSNLISSVGVTAGSIFTAASGSSSVLGTSGTAGVSLAVSLATASIAAVTNVGLAALGSTTLAQSTLHDLGYIGTGSTTSAFPTVFINGIMSTGAIPTAITVTSTAVTYIGSFAAIQPWFALLGA